MKQQSCPRLHQKQSEDLNSKIFLGRGEGGMPPAPPSRQACLLVCHTLLSSRYHPPPSPPPPPPNSKSPRYHPLSPPTQNHPATTLRLRCSCFHLFKCLYILSYSHTPTLTPSHTRTYTYPHINDNSKSSCGSDQLQ